MITGRKKEAFIFFSGVSVMQVIVHISFAVSAVLPIRILGILHTETSNSIAIMVWAILAALLIYLSWFKRT